MQRAMIQKIILPFLFVIYLITYTVKANALINIVAAENVYGEVAKELGGSHVNVISIINKPSQDPHLFTITPSAAKAVSLADIVVYNGANYDPWILPLLNLQGKNNRKVMSVAALVNTKPGDNPHIWYSPSTMPIFAKALVAILINLDPKHQHDYKKQLNQFNDKYQIIFKTIKQLQQQYQNMPVIATEPVFGYMAKSIGLKMHGEAFQANMMNDIPQTVSQIKAFEDDLRHHSVRLFIYNNQVINPLTQHMLNIARKEKIPVLGVNETIPPGMTYVQWIITVLNEFKNALKNG